MKSLLATWQGVWCHSWFLNSHSSFSPSCTSQWSCCLLSFIKSERNLSEVAEWVISLDAYLLWPASLWSEWPFPLIGLAAPGLSLVSLFSPSCQTTLCPLGSRVAYLVAWTRLTACKLDRRNQYSWTWRVSGTTVSDIGCLKGHPAMGMVWLNGDWTQQLRINQIMSLWV